MAFPCQENSADNKFCKGHSGLLYSDDFTVALAGRWTVNEGGNGTGWELAPGEGYTGWSLDGTAGLKVDHGLADEGLYMSIVNDEFPNPYVMDARGRDYPWFMMRSHQRPLAPYPDWPPDGPPYEGWAYSLAYGGFEHKSQLDPDDRLSFYHGHQCGSIRTWCFIYYFKDGLYSGKSALVNMASNWWFHKHHVTPTEIQVGHGWPGGTGFASDTWRVPYEIQKYQDLNGKFGLGTACCGFAGAAPALVDSEVIFHGLRVTETNYITITNIPPDPRGAYAIGGQPEGAWEFEIYSPTVGSIFSEKVRPNGAAEIDISFNLNIHGQQKVLCRIIRDDGQAAVNFAEMEPLLGVNGGDIYCFEANGQADVICEDLDSENGNGNGEPPVGEPEPEGAGEDLPCPIYPDVSSFGECEGGVWPDEVNICPTD